MTKKKCSNNKVKCDVESCKFQNNEEGICELDEIQISCNCSNDDCDCCDETVCESFEYNEDNKNNDDDEVDD